MPADPPAAHAARAGTAAGSPPAQCHEMSCFVMRGPPPPGCAAGALAAGASLAAGFAARAGRGSVTVIRASSFGARGGTGVPVLRAFRVCGRAGPRARFAAARFARLTARARRRTPFSSCRTRPSPSCPDSFRGPGTVGRGPLRNCHEMSCDVMEARCGLLLFALLALPLPFAPCPVFERVRRRSVTLPSRLAGGVGGGPLGECRPSPGCARRFRWRESGPSPGLPRKRGGGGFGRLAAGLRRQFGTGIVHSHACLLPGKAKGGTGCPCFARVSRGRGCAGRGRAYRGGAVRAPDCPRETADAPRPSVPAGVFFAAPAIAFCRKAERRPPGEPPLSTFILHHLGESQVHSGTKNENIGDFSWTADGMEARRSSSRQARDKSGHDGGVVQA